MEDTFWILGSFLSVTYTLYTTPKEDYKKIPIHGVIIVIIILLMTNWFGLIMSIASDVNSIKKKLK